MLFLIAFLLCILCCGASLTANETEILAVAAVQASPSMTALKTELFQLISKTNTIRSVPGIFSQQDGVYPSEGELQLPLFGAKIPWPDVMQELTADSNRVLLIMIRHGEAWENVNPLSNDHCEFLFEGHVINNFDSDLDPAGIRQAQDLNSLLRSDAPYAANGTRSWFDALELSNKVKRYEILHASFPSNFSSTAIFVESADKNIANFEVRSGRPARVESRGH